MRFLFDGVDHNDVGHGWTIDEEKTSTSLKNLRSFKTFCPADFGMRVDDFRQSVERIYSFFGLSKPEVLEVESNDGSVLVDVLMPSRELNDSQGIVRDNYQWAVAKEQEILQQRLR